LTPTHAEDESVLINVYDKTAGLDDGVRIAHAIFGIQEASRSEKLKSVEMLDWCLNEQMMGDSYTGYFVTYKVKVGDETWYTLVDLIEFDSGSYEGKFIDTDRSLSTIQSMLY
jgi:hypothetical protein